MKYEFVTKEWCEDQLEKHRRLNGMCDAEHFIREAFGRLLAEREAFRDIAIRYNLSDDIDAEAHAILSRQDKGEESK